MLFNGHGPKPLRSDQATAIATLRESIGHGQRRIVMQAPTGWGKTVLEAELAQRARAKSKRVLITVPMLSLVDQTVEMLAAQGVRDVGVIQAQHQLTDGSQPVQVASVQTLLNRQIPVSDLVMIDEVHKWFKMYEGWLQALEWQNVPIIGLSATPWTKGLGAYFSKLIVANTIAEMIQGGLLAPFRVFAPSHPDLKNVRIRAGDYVEEDLFEAMKPKPLVANIVETWKALAQGRPTVCFAVNRAHAAQIAKEFEENGIRSAYMDANTPLLDRGTIRAKLKARDIDIVCNVDVIGLGVDWPEVSCIVYARPTRSQMRYVQNIGRGLRIDPAGGKNDLIVIDHSDTTLRLGFVTDIHHTGLDDGKPKLTAEPVIALPKECPQCHYVKPPKTAKCPNCGFVAERQPTAIMPKDGELHELEQVKMKPAPVAARLEGKAQTYGQLMWYVRHKGKKDGMAAHLYREIYGVWPRVDWEPHFKAPEMVLASWLVSRNIRYAKSREKERKAEERTLPASQRQVPGTLMTEEDLKHAFK